MEILLDKDTVDELAAMASLGKRLPAIVSKITEIGPKAVLPTLANQLSEAMGMDFGQVMHVLYGLWGLYRLRTANEETSQATVEHVTAKLKDQPFFAAWQAAQAEIGQALDALQEDHALFVSHKAERAAGSKANRVISMELYTDARAVFSEEGNRVVFTVIDHTLSLEYHAGYRQHREIELVFDADDIEHLMGLCLQAEEQARAMKVNISGPSGLPFESGENT